MYSKNYLQYHQYMPYAFRALFLATVVLTSIAIAPLLINAYGYYQMGISGCILPQNEPKPTVHCSPIIPSRNGTVTQQESKITQLLDYSMLALITIPLAGVPAFATATLCLFFGVKELLRKRTLHQKKLKKSG